MNKNYPLYICIFCFLLLNIFLVFSNISSKNNQNDYFRLHVVANSNCVDDQIIKLNVVKKVNEYLNSLYESSLEISSSNEKEDTKYVIKNNIDNILEIANNELTNQCASYNCYANIGKIKYDEKKSEQINMNEGIYDSIQIVLGDGKGENFWSLIFPYSYNPNFDVTNNSDYIYTDEIEVKSGILEAIKKVVKNFKS